MVSWGGTVPFPTLPSGGLDTRYTLGRPGDSLRLPYQHPKEDIPPFPEKPWSPLLGTGQRHVVTWSQGLTPKPLLWEPPAWALFGVAETMSPTERGR